MSAAIERDQFQVLYGHYSKPWCLEGMPDVDPLQTKTRRLRAWQNDDDVGMLERWLREFSDERSGTSSPPPMS